MAESRHQRTTRETSRRRYLTAAASMGLTLAAGCSGSASEGSASWSAKITAPTERDYVQDVSVVVTDSALTDALKLAVELNHPEGPAVEGLYVRRPGESEPDWVGVDIGQHVAERELWTAIASRLEI